MQAAPIARRLCLERRGVAAMQQPQQQQQQQQAARAMTRFQALAALALALAPRTLNRMTRCRATLRRSDVDGGKGRCEMQDNAQDVRSWERE